MAGRITPSSYWCMIRSSPKLRELVKYKLEQKDKTLKEICKEIGIKQSRLSKYLNNRSPNITQFQLMQVLRYLGIEVTLDIKIVE